MKNKRKVNFLNTQKRLHLIDCNNTVSSFLHYLNMGGIDPTSYSKV